MFIPPSFIFPGLHAQDRTLIDKISEWFSRLLTQIEHFLAENYNNLSKWAISIARAANEPLQRHPYVAIFVSLLLCLGPWIFLLPLFLFQALIFTIFYILGLGSSAIVGGSPTDLYQAFCYGGHTPAHSMLVMLQSAGTHYNEDTVNHRLFLAISKIEARLFVLAVRRWTTATHATSWVKIRDKIESHSTPFSAFISNT
ncbi:hypothetical protein E4T56_gene9292 [Termitomyces sp. T112]|nr:hypothetical protein E4T56_gene9292 [Termitomyces sp. T112]